MWTDGLCEMKGECCAARCIHATHVLHFAWHISLSFWKAHSLIFSRHIRFKLKTILWSMTQLCVNLLSSRTWATPLSHQHVNSCSHDGYYSFSKLKAFMTLVFSHVVVSMFKFAKLRWCSDVGLCVCLVWLWWTRRSDEIFVSCRKLTSLLFNASSTFVENGFSERHSYHDTWITLESF